ncbi:tyrosine protein phosphatase [Bacillus carboniphilus]|uniref:Tyrosine-protein phosphatase n=1 Tax=Bacillus carboniphilus TaxID=86663 RepID=A0ABY9JRY6_9BACI|nr:CpsB/CapC family capsule biosynthesis tyrosine phosphatase [Bacillus carboniphilus]WLR41579.1 tyrosine protein phosphatase [Bacillus carboniphilus]
MIDCHCHILPGVDDGAANMEESIAMAKMASKEGIEVIVATPHHQTRHYHNPKEKVSEWVTRLNGVLQQEGVPIKVVPGQEVRLYGELAKDLDLDIQTLHNSSYVLVEFPSNHVPRYVTELFFELKLKGITPIIAHPERNAEIIQQPDLLFQLIDKGALAQLTNASIIGDFGRKIQKFSLQLLEHGQAHIVASDAHNLTNRPFYTREALHVIEKKLGQDMVFYFTENAQLLIANKTIDRIRPTPIRKRVFGIF